jgi:ADP-dependent NAD(P)H-hydrate dehydratase / NAD(P)H-hydrate epimerase
MKFKPILNVAELREVEHRASGEPLMERAGLAAAEVARDMLNGRKPRVLVVAGHGNNGGDAFVVARWLAAWFYDVVVVFDGRGDRLPQAAAAAYQAWIQSGGSTVATWPDTHNVSVIVDGLFGIGLSRALDGGAADWIERANASAIPILALDIPSGLAADSGCAQAPTIRAMATSTFIALKPGLLTADGPDHCGRIHVHGLGLEDSVDTCARGRRLDWDVMSGSLPAALQ